MTSTALRSIARFILLSLLRVPLLAQSIGATSLTAETQAGPAATAAFELADVHPTPPTATPWMTGGMLHGQRYLLHNATLVDMISLAYGVKEDDILGGPAWLDFDRFDVFARAPLNTSPDDIKLMLRAMLTERFKLIVHPGTNPRLSYVLRIYKGAPKLKQAAPADASGIEEHDAPADAAHGVLVSHTVSAHNQTMAQVADLLQRSAGSYLPRPVVDATGLKGGWDFNLTWAASPAPGGVSIFDAVCRQLGLKLSLEKSPSPVLLVDSVNRRPTPNAPDIDKMLPAPPPPEFDAVVLKPSKPGTKFSAKITGSEITAAGATLKFFVAYAYGINYQSTDLIVNTPNFFDQDRWDLLAKAAPDSFAIGRDGQPKFDFDLLPHMVQTMLIDRFHMKSHLEDHTINAPTLVADHPRMKKADPLNRSGCREGPGADGKDPRITNSILGRLLSCQNMTMTEFAAELPTFAQSDIFTPLLDATGLTGAYDFTLSFSSIGDLHNNLPQFAEPSNPAEADRADPSGGLTLREAMARQLGLRLEDRKRSVPVLVIDHIDEQPSEN